MGSIASRTDEYPVADETADVDASNSRPSPDAPGNLGSEDRNSSSFVSIVATEFKWSFGGHSVFVTGAWDNWDVNVALSRSTLRDFTTVLSLPLGTFQYKFIVDGNWKHNPAYPTETDQHGNLNNIIKVVAKRPEYNCDEPLMPISEASSPRESYDYSTLPQEDHATEPPTLPRLLASAPLNKSLSSGGGGTDFVRLNHIFETNSDVVYGANEVRTIACEIRYKSKIITTVLVMSKRKVVAQGLLSEQQAFENNTGQANSGMTTPAGLSLGESQSLILDALNNV